MPLEPWSEVFIYRGVACGLQPDPSGPSIIGELMLDMPDGQTYVSHLQVSARDMDAPATRKRARHEAKRLAVTMLRARRAWYPDA